MDSLRGRVLKRRAEMRLGIRLMRLVSMFFVLVLGPKVICGGRVALHGGVAMGRCLGGSESRRRDRTLFIGLVIEVLWSMMETMVIEIIVLCVM